MWFSRIQKSLPLPGTEAEYMAMAESLKGISFARQIIAFMRPRTKLDAVPLYEDNNLVIHLAKYPMGSARSKRI